MLPKGVIFEKVSNPQSQLGDTIAVIGRLLYVAAIQVTAFWRSNYRLR